LLEWLKMTKKCDECQRPIDWAKEKGTQDMYAYEPCNKCKCGMFGVIPNLEDHFIQRKIPKEEFAAITHNPPFDWQHPTDMHY